MKALVDKYSKKIICSGLAKNPLICGMDDKKVWNREDADTKILKSVMADMNILSIMCAEPEEPYRTILKFLAKRYAGVITPRDCETRTFLHDLPVISAFSAEDIVKCLLRRKSVIVNDNNLRVITFGTVSPEQAFITFSSVCFACFVLFFSEYLSNARAGAITKEQSKAFNKAVPLLIKPPEKPPVLMHWPFTKEAEVYSAIIQAGKKVVEYGLVDSFFGNISYLFNDTIYISQTGASLDDLAGCIDPCPMDGSSCAGITASSELSAHNEIFLKTKNRAILHGHPEFSVILSMDCEKKDCSHLGHCHIECPQKRFVQNISGDIPIVPGEVGTGPKGLCNTLPPAIVDRRGAIVWGHGLFTVSANDFNEALANMLKIENMCREKYFQRLKLLGAL